MIKLMMKSFFFLFIYFDEEINIDNSNENFIRILIFLQL